MFQASWEKNKTLSQEVMKSVHYREAAKSSSYDFLILFCFSSLLLSFLPLLLLFSSTSFSFSSSPSSSFFPYFLYLFIYTHINTCMYTYLYIAVKIDWLIDDKWIHRYINQSILLFHCFCRGLQRSEEFSKCQVITHPKTRYFNEYLTKNRLKIVKLLLLAMFFTSM